MAGTVPVRERIVALFTSKMEAMQALSGGGVMWDLVTREPLTAARVKQNETAIGVYDIKEKKSPKIGVTMCDLTIMVEFFYRLRLGDTPSTELSVLLSAIERAACADQNFGGLTIDINLVGSELDLETVTDKLASGVATFVATYRHKTGDPFSLIGE